MRAVSGSPLNSLSASAALSPRTYNTRYIHEFPSRWERRTKKTKSHGATKACIDKGVPNLGRRFFRAAIITVQACSVVTASSTEPPRGSNAFPRLVLRYHRVNAAGLGAQIGKGIIPHLSMGPATLYEDAGKKQLRNRRDGGKNSYQAPCRQ